MGAAHRYINALVAYDDAGSRWLRNTMSQSRAGSDGAEGRPVEIQLFEWASQSAPSSCSTLRILQLSYPRRRRRRKLACGETGSRAAIESVQRLPIGLEVYATVGRTRVLILPAQ